MKVRHIALIPAAGAGSRMGGSLPKQYQLLAGQPVLWHTLAVLAAERSAQEAAGRAFVENDAPNPLALGAAPSDKPKSKTEQVAEAKAFASEHKVDFITAMKKLGFAS